MKKAIILISTLMNTLIITAQENDKEYELNHQLEVIMGIPYSTIKNESIANDEFKSVDNHNGVLLGVNYNKYFFDIFGISIGLNYTSYTKDVYQKGYFERLDQTDQDGEKFDMLYISDVTENYAISFLEVPLTIKAIIGNPKKIYGYIEGGVIYGVFLNKGYDKSGSIENQGRYSLNGNPYWDAVSHNNSYYGHDVEIFTKSTKDIYNSHNLSGRIALGLTAVVNDNISLKIVPTYTFGMTDIIKQEVEYENVFGQKSPYTPTKTSSVGINFGVVFNL